MTYPTFPYMAPVGHTVELLYFLSHRTDPRGIFPSLKQVEEKIIGSGARIPNEELIRTYALFEVGFLHPTELATQVHSDVVFTAVYNFRKRMTSGQPPRRPRDPVAVRIFDHIMKTPTTTRGTFSNRKNYLPGETPPTSIPRLRRKPKRGN